MKRNCFPMVLACLSVLCVSSAFFAVAADDDPGHDLTSGQIRVMSYNIRHAKGMDGQVDLQRIAEVIKSEAPDLVTLQEVDQKTRRVAGVDQPQELASLTGMEVLFAYGIELSGGYYGNVVLSKHPIVSSKRIQLPGDESRSALCAKLRVAGSGGREFVFIGTHLDNSSHDKRMQSIAIIENYVQTETDGTAILAGDLNALPDSPELKTLTCNWVNATDADGFFTWRSDNPTKQIDYILFRPSNAWQVLDSRVIDEPTASDHLPITTTFQFR